MLKSKITQPEVIHALARTGHGSRLLITDSNYAADVLSSESATRIFLNFMPGKLLVTEIMEGILSAVPVEQAYSMLTDAGENPDIVQDFRRLLPDRTELSALKRDDFYALAQDHRTSVVIVSGDQRLFANIILVVGFIHPDGTPQY